MKNSKTNVFIGPNAECLIAMHRHAGVKLWLHKPEVVVSDSLAESLEKAGIERKTFSNKKEAMETLKELGPSNFLQMFGFPYRLPQTIIDQFHRVYNLHPGSLENCRGAEPIHHSILRGDTHFVLSLHEVPDEEFDSGPVCQTASLPIDYEASFLVNCSRLTAIACGVLTSHYIMTKFTPRPPSVRLKLGDDSYRPKLSGEIITKIEKASSLNEATLLANDGWKQQIAS